MPSRDFFISDHNSGSPETCTQYYIVQYRVSGSGVWQQLFPLPTEASFSIIDLKDATTYEYSITRVCCNGIMAAPATGIFTTPVLEPAPPTEVDVFISADQTLPYTTGMANLSSDFNGRVHSILWEQTDGEPVTIVSPTDKSTMVSGLAFNHTYTFKVTYNGAYSKTTTITVIDISDIGLYKDTITADQTISISNPLDRVIYQDFRFYNYASTTKTITPTVRITRVTSIDPTLLIDSGSWEITNMTSYWLAESLDEISIEPYSYSDTFMARITITASPLTAGDRSGLFILISPMDDNGNNNAFSITTHIIT